MLNTKYKVFRSLGLIFLAVATSLSVAAQTLKVLHAFGNNGDGAPPLYGQVFDRQGNLYGITNYGPVGDGCVGDGGCGSVYKLKPNADGTWTESLIHIFGESGGSYPSSSLIFDTQGNLYGSTYAQGQYPDVVYQLAPGSNGTWTESALYQFPPQSLGTAPGELLLDPSGNIFGVADIGGANQAGSVFHLDRSNGWQESTLWSFSGYPSDGGASPEGPTALDANGNFYGTTFIEGSHDCGVVYKLTRQGSQWQEIVLYAFRCGSDGKNPEGVIFGPDGSLYGVTADGGNTGIVGCLIGCGTVYKLSPNADGTWTKTTLYAFRGMANHDGAVPYSQPTFDSNGNLYGSTVSGGNYNAGCLRFGCGTVFKLTPSSGGHWTESVVYRFTGGSDGYNPESPIVIDGAGNLYGTTYYGGLYGGGIAYEIMLGHHGTGKTLETTAPQQHDGGND